MTNPDFEATWIPRIGEKATAELRRCRLIGMSAIVAGLVFAATASIALGGDTLDKALGVVLLAGMVGALATFISCQRKIAAAVSEWFGVRITAGQLPPMNPKRFDAWRERVQLEGQARRPNGSQGLEPLRLKYDHKWGPIRWSSSARRDSGQ
jgi:hypothetical protein